MKPSSILLHILPGFGWQLYAIYPGGKRFLLKTFSETLGLDLVRQLAGIVAATHGLREYQED